MTRISGWRVLVAAEREEVLPLGRGHDHGVPEERLQETIRDLLVEADLRRLEQSDAGNGEVTCVQPVLPCQSKSLAAQLFCRLHPTLVLAPPHG